MSLNGIRIRSDLGPTSSIVRGAGGFPFFSCVSFEKTRSIPKKSETFLFVDAFLFSFFIIIFLQFFLTFVCVFFGYFSTVD